MRQAILWMTFGFRQIGVFTGSLIILAITLLFIRWIGASRRPQLRGIGVLSLVMTLALEISIVVEASRDRLRSDCNVLEGGLMPLGIIILTLSPWIARKMRGLPTSDLVRLEQGKEA